MRGENEGILIGKISRLSKQDTGQMYRSMVISMRWKRDTGNLSSRGLIEIEGKGVYKAS